MAVRGRSPAPDGQPAAGPTLPAETLAAVVIILVWEGATAAIAAVFAVWANWDYLREVARREAKPRLASWVIWTVAMTVGSAGAARMAQWPAAALGFAGAATCGAVVVAGWRRGDKKLTWLDGFALIAGGAGIVLLTAAMLWPDRFPITVAIGISVLTDLCAFVPTYHNARKGEEVPRPYIIDTIGAAAALAGARHFPQPVGVIFPAYQVVACAAAAWLAAVGKARADKAPEHLKATAETNADVRQNAFVVRDNLILGDPAMAAGLRRHRDAGGRTVVDATTIGLSPRPDLVARIARLTGVNVVAGAAFYSPLASPVGLPGERSRAVRGPVGSLMTTLAAGSEPDRQDRLRRPLLGPAPAGHPRRPGGDAADRRARPTAVAVQPARPGRQFFPVADPEARCSRVLGRRVSKCLPARGPNSTSLSARTSGLELPGRRSVSMAAH